MKKARKLITFILTVVMVLSMSMNVWAATITIEGGANGSTYEAYKLLDATDGGDDKFAYTLNDKYDEILKTVTEKDNEADIIDYISKLDEKAIQNFANEVYAAIKAANPAIPADSTTTNNIFTGVQQGYYLIAETVLGNSDEAYSLVMLDTAGNENINVTTKEETPTLTKQITSNDNVANDKLSNNASIGSTVQFTLTATIPQEAEYYDYYFCIFSDKLSNGLTFDDTTLNVTATGTTAPDYNLYTGTDVDEAATYADGNTFQIALENAKELAGQTVTVTYEAELNENAEIGDGNTNTADLKYSNDPNTQYGDKENNDAPGKPDPDPDIPMADTPDRVTNTYTTGIKLFKTGENDQPLEGATFQITGNGVNMTKAVALDDEGNSALTFEGLGAGIYTITETVVPAGYNKAKDITVTITWNGEGAGEMWTATVSPAEGNDTLTFDDEEGVFGLTIKNQAGSELPSTGGIGTTIFYIVGGALVLFAVVLLVTKKRMKNEQ